MASYPRRCRFRTFYRLHPRYCYTLRWQLLSLVAILICNLIDREETCSYLQNKALFLNINFKSFMIIERTIINCDILHTSKTTETGFFIIFAYVRLIVPPHRCPEIGWCSNWSLAYHSTGCISCCSIFLFIILRIIVQASVNLVVLFSF